MCGLSSFIILLLSFSFVSCVPTTPSSSRPSSVNSSEAPSPTGGTSADAFTNFSNETRPFFLINNERQFDVYSASLEAQDNLLLSGVSVQNYLKNISDATRSCIFWKFTISGSVKVLVTSALKRTLVLSQTSSQRTVMLAWLIFPNDQSRNQNDCLTSGIVSAKNTLYGTAATLHFSTSDICATCTSAPISEAGSPRSNSGGALSVDLAALKMRLTTQTTTPPSDQCTSHSACNAIGFNCCLESQCVNDGALRPNLTSTPELISAIEDVTNNPLRFLLYPQFYYVCPNRPDNNPPGGGSDPVDPAFAALKRFNRMRDYFQCLNPQNDEISYCYNAIPQASLKINSGVPADRLFTMPLSDTNLSWANSALSTRSTIFSVRYGEQILYQEDSATLNQTTLTGSHTILGSGNASPTIAQSIEVTKALPSNAGDDELVIQYKIDGSCERLNSTLARCVKKYVQGQNSTPAKPSDHPTGQIFNLPPYAFPAPISPLVKVGDTTSTNWNLVPGVGIQFTTPVTANQRVTITYYLSTPTVNLDQFFQGQVTAQAAINQECGCGTQGNVKCNLTPKTQTVSGVTTVIGYDCVYPSGGDPVVPLQQTIFLSAQTVPLRYFDVNGVAWDDETYTSAPAQEGIAFSYTSGNRLQPNNLSQYVGMQEIFGSFDKTASAAKPPRMLRLKRNVEYDIFVDSGGLSNCSNCGSDPYQAVLRLFPQTFAQKGGGLVPDRQNSSRQNSTGVNRADDLLFGRACFVPPTMLPFSQTTQTDIQRQRLLRQASQHFLFANGYQRDWYGFDYGSIIGSYDGVRWFSIGNQRRIRAQGTKLYLAVNALFGDQSINDSFKIVVSEASVAPSSGSLVDHDTESDGAQCQREHFCSTDQDCIGRLGYDYTCQNVTELTTSWPSFDQEGNELSGTQTASLLSLVGGANGQTKRCVYRGRGTPCTANLSAVSGSGFTTATSLGFHTCSPNNYCANVATSNRFNTAISRWAASPQTQNTVTPSTSDDLDVFGLGARIIGRPQNFYGNRSATTISPAAYALSSTTLAQHLTSQLLVSGLCLPGKVVESATNYNTGHSLVPSATDPDSADRLFGVGASGKLSASITLNPKLYNFCPTLDASKSLRHQTPSAFGTDYSGASQNISSSLLNLTDYQFLNILTATDTTRLTALQYQRHACLRAPGASCLSDLECAPSRIISQKMRTLSSWGGFANNPTEKAFWTSELVCGNSEPIKLFEGTTNDAFDPKNNRCCRENNTTFQTFSQYFNPLNTTNTTFINCTGPTPAIAGVTIAYNAARRNVQNNIVADKMTCNPAAMGGPGSYPALVSPVVPTTETATGKPITEIIYQYNTLDLANQRMCCTGNWVRSFATENGGGHKWGPNTNQSIESTIFRAWNWQPDQIFMGTLLDEPENMACSADNFGTAACEIRNLTDTQALEYLRWIDRFELVGVPQVMIPYPKASAPNNYGKVVDDLTQAAAVGDVPLKNTLKIGVTPDNNISLATGGSESYISAANYEKIEVGSGKLKKIFSESEFNCCIPAGGKIPQGASPNMCCTGTLTDNSEVAPGEPVCCLDDYSDVSLYLNRYVSSEGRGLSDSAYDPETGYIKDPAQVLSIATAKKLCCSGNIVPGVAVSNLLIPLQGGRVNPLGKSRRFVSYPSIDNDASTGNIESIYRAGIRWNNHYYCAPASYSPPAN
jgi:hypothetical protein